LIEAIWPGRIESEAALSCRISAARRALGDGGNAAAALTVGEAAAQPAPKDAPQLVPSAGPLPLPDYPRSRCCRSDRRRSEPEQIERLLSSHEQEVAGVDHRSVAEGDGLVVAVEAGVDLPLIGRADLGE
jgi:hypothetical protein